MIHGTTNGISCQKLKIEKSFRDESSSHSVCLAYYLNLNRWTFSE